jgi:pantoate--beta-alanine ligase
MIIVRHKKDLRKTLMSRRLKNPSMITGFVPTMGFLHGGHSALIKTARDENEYLIASIFVNPTQFGPGEDFDSYPRNEDQDIALCKQHGVDLLFIPEASEMYQPNAMTTVSVSKLTESLCGRYRPGHFQGVTTIVTKLFNLVLPQNAYFGQKDAQQSLVIRRMVHDLDIHTQIHICPTVRESDGLAMSSRNVRLSKKARALAPLVYKGLESSAKLAMVGERDIASIVKAARNVLDTAPEINIQYLECRDRDMLRPMQTLDRPGVLAVAVFLDEVRLIDNVFLDPEEN